METLECFALVSLAPHHWEQEVQALGGLKGLGTARKWASELT